MGLKQGEKMLKQLLLWWKVTESNLGNSHPKYLNCDAIIPECICFLYSAIRPDESLPVECDNVILYFSSKSSILRSMDLHPYGAFTEIQI